MLEKIMSRPMTQAVTISLPPLPRSFIRTVFKSTPRPPTRCQKKNATLPWRLRVRLGDIRVWSEPPVGCSYGFVYQTTLISTLRPLVEKGANFLPGQFFTIGAIGCHICAWLLDTNPNRYAMGYRFSALY